MNKVLKVTGIAILMTLTFSASNARPKPNILWILSEDLSPFMGCYGDPVNSGHTPAIDQLAADGVLFTRAYATAPVCSASRSALITGVMQTTTGTHQHRSSRTTDGEVVPEDVRIHLPEGMKTIPELMQEAGYFTFNCGKDDYNFHYDRRVLYETGTMNDYRAGMNGWQGNRDKYMLSENENVWTRRPDEDQPWFGQIQLMGGKAGAKHVREGELLKDHDVTLPPYFPDVPSQRKAWTSHYNANRGADARVEQILTMLEEDGELEYTIVIFFSDHGSNTSLRHKQFCYEGGLHVPLMIKGDHPRLKAGTIRTDLVTLLDVAATTLSFGGAEIPGYLDGQDLFGKKYSEAEYVIGARDRCDYTIDRIRSVRSDRFRYIRNYFPDRPMLQAGYRDHQPIVTDLKKLYKEGNLTDYQAEHWFGVRPLEELYDMEADPHQVRNLVSEPGYGKILEQHRNVLEEWILETGDRGQYPEPAVQLKGTYDLWKDRPRFRDADVNPEYDQFRNADPGKSSGRSQPNVLFIAIDDLNDWVGPLGGHPQVLTPNMDQFCNEGAMVFRNAVCAAPICGPSRSALLSGFMPHRTGVYGNNTNMIYSDLVKEHATLPEYFTKNGYHTLANGKIFHKHATASGVDFGHWAFDEFARSRRYVNNGADPRYLTSAGGVIKGEALPEYSGPGSKLRWGPTKCPLDSMVDYKVADWARQQMNREWDQPFFLAVGFIKPHLSWFVPKQFFDMYDPDTIVVPEVFEKDLEDILNPDGTLLHKPSADYKWVKEHRLEKEATRAYLASVTFADHCLGMVLDALDKSGYAKNTVVVLWGDHGYHLGEKLRYMKNTIWAEVAKAPFMVRVPGMDKMVYCDRTVSFIDIYPTLISLCGLPEKELDGHDFSHLLKDPESSWEYPGITVSSGGTSVMGERYHFISNLSGAEELYDLEKDPMEWKNLVRQPEYKEIIEQMRKWVPKKRAESSKIFFKKPPNYVNADADPTIKNTRDLEHLK